MALDEEIAGLHKKIESERDGIAVLRAEWSLLNRPERIERLAAKYLKLAPAAPRQLVTLDSLDRPRFRACPDRGAGRKRPSPRPLLLPQPVD